MLSTKLSWFLVGSSLLFSSFSPARAATIPRDLQAGDSAFKARKSETRARDALRFYREAWKKNPKDPSAGWRVAMASYFVGLRLTQDEESKKRIHEEGIAAGKAAIALSKTCAPCLFWTAINQALSAQVSGSLSLLGNVSEIKNTLRESLKLDAAYASGGAYRLLGLIDQKLPGILGGSNERAKQSFLRAIEVAPDEPLNYLFLAKLQAKELGQPEEAKSTLRRGLEVKKPASDRLESIEALAEIRALLAPGSEIASR